MIEPMTNQEYVEKGGKYCPKCHSKAIEGGSSDFDGTTCVMHVICLACDYVWYDCYKLVGYCDTKKGW